MIAVIFEVYPRTASKADYFTMAAQMRPLLDEVEGFVSVERFQSLTDPEKILSLSFFSDEDAVARWRNLVAHRSAQQTGRTGMFDDYRLRVAHVLRDYGMHEREEAPDDSRTVHED